MEIKIVLVSLFLEIKFQKNNPNIEKENLKTFMQNDLKKNDK
jgi:hypothetical protein